MKVCFLVEMLVSGGVERTVVYLSKYFADHGIDTTILSISNEIFYDVDEKVNLVSLGIPRSFNDNISIFEKYLRIVKRMTKVKKFILSGNFDVVFCMAPEAARYVLPFYKKGKFKLISSERNNPLFDNSRNKKIKKELFDKCDGIVFQTVRAMDCFPPEVRGKGVVIPNAVGNELAYTLTASSEKKNKFSAVGRLTKQKDYTTMFRAFSLFSKKHPGYELEIFGVGEDKAMLENLACELGIGEHVKFMGVDQRALEYISDAKAFLLSSIYEGIPNVLIEAMAIGMTCISTDCPFGPSEMIENGKNGLLVPVGDEKSFADAMCRVVEDSDFAKKCGDNAREIKNNYSIENISARYADYVKKIVNG